MENEMQEALFWLPSEFLDDDFFTHEEKSGVSLPEADEEKDFMADLTKQMTNSFLLNGEKDHSQFPPKADYPKDLAGSPQSTLYGHESSNGPSQVNSPPSSPPEQRKEDPWDLLYQAADQVMRMRINILLQNQCSQAFNGLSGPATKNSANPIKNPYAGIYPTHHSVLSQRQIQAAQFYHLRQQQLLKQQIQQQNFATAVWGEQSRPRVGSGNVNGAPLGLSRSAWSPIHKTDLNPLPGSDMRAVYLSGVKRESAGTGVFLPRRTGTVNEPPRKKPNCSTVLLPTRVVHALNLNLDDFNGQARINGGFMLDHDALVNRSNVMTSGYQKRPVEVRSQPSVQAMSGLDLNLPQEWTY